MRNRKINLLQVYLPYLGTVVVAIGAYALVRGWYLSVYGYAMIDSLLINIGLAFVTVGLPVLLVMPKRLRLLKFANGYKKFRTILGLCILAGIPNAVVQRMVDQTSYKIAEVATVAEIDPKANESFYKVANFELDVANHGNFPEQTSHPIKFWKHTFDLNVVSPFAADPQRCFLGADYGTSFKDDRKNPKVDSVYTAWLASSIEKYEGQITTSVQYFERVWDQDELMEYAEAASTLGPIAELNELVILEPHYKTWDQNLARSRRNAIMSLLMAMTVALVVLMFPKPLVPEPEEQEYEA